MKVRMLRSVGGSWPPKGELHEVEDWRGSMLISNGWAEAAEDSTTAEPPAASDLELPVIEDYGNDI